MLLEKDPGRLLQWSFPERLESSSSYSWWDLKEVARYLYVLLWIFCQSNLWNKSSTCFPGLNEKTWVPWHVQHCFCWRWFPIKREGLSWVWESIGSGSETSGLSGLPSLLLQDVCWSPYQVNQMWMSKQSRLWQNKFAGPSTMSNKRLYTEHRRLILDRV